MAKKSEPQSGFKTVLGGLAVIAMGCAVLWGVVRLMGTADRYAQTVPSTNYDRYQQAAIEWLESQVAGPKIDQVWETDQLADGRQHVKIKFTRTDQSTLFADVFFDHDGRVRGQIDEIERIGPF